MKLGCRFIITLNKFCSNYNQEEESMIYLDDKLETADLKKMG
jgi:hypothetical protein